MALWLKPNTQITIDGDGTMMCELYADETTDLDDNLDGVDLAPGSIALVISTGDFYVFNGSENWVNVTTPAEPNASVNNSRGVDDGLKKSADNAEDEPKDEPEEELEEVKESDGDDEMVGDTESEQRSTRKR